MFDIQRYAMVYASQFELQYIVNKSQCLLTKIKTTGNDFLIIRFLSNFNRIYHHIMKFQCYSTNSAMIIFLCECVIILAFSIKRIFCLFLIVGLRCEKLFFNCLLRLSIWFIFMPCVMVHDFCLHQLCYISDILMMFCHITILVLGLSASHLPKPARK